MFIFSEVTRFLTRWGFCCNHVFAAITGYGIAVSLKDIKPLSILRRREVSLLGVFIPVYIIASIVFILFCGGFNLFYMVYYQDSAWKTLLNIAFDMFGLSDMFKLKLLNPTWWYFSAVHFFIIGMILIFCLFRKRLVKTGYILIWSGLLILMIFKPILYGCMMLSALSGFMVF